MPWRSELPADKRFQNAINKDRETITGGDDDNWEYFLGKGIAAGVSRRNGDLLQKAIPEDAPRRLSPACGTRQGGPAGSDRRANRGHMGNVARVRRRYQRLKASRRSLRFEDVTRRLGDRGLGDRLEEVVYRLDGQVAHLLLDEFQDTSALQWRVLRPFAQRVVGGGADRSLFCVGDVKQAIYGWRGGVAEIFDALDEEFGPLPAQALNESFRSSPVVIDCVNRSLRASPAIPRCRGVRPLPKNGRTAVHGAYHRQDGIARLLPPDHAPAAEGGEPMGGHAPVRRRGSRAAAPAIAGA